MRRTILLWLSVALVACGGGAPRVPATPLTATDDAGRQVTLAHPAARIVSLAPSSTELLFALGAGDRVVGRTTWCRYPAAAEAVPVVGDGLNPNIEAVTARRPELVVLYRSPLNETAASQLDRLGVAALVLKQDRLEDIGRAARLLGRLTGREAAGDSIAAALEALVADTLIPSAPPASHPARRRLAIIAWDNPPIVIGAGSFLDQLVGLAGAENVFHDLAAASATVGIETIAIRDPDLIVRVSDDSVAGLPAFATQPQWQAVRAVRRRRFVALPGDLFGQPGPRAALAVAELRRRLEATP